MGKEGQRDEGRGARGVREREMFSMCVKREYEIKRERTERVKTEKEGSERDPLLGKN